MIDKIEEIVHGKSPRLNNPKTYVLLHNRFNTYMVLIFGDLNKTQICKMPYRDGPYHEIEILMSFKNLNFPKPNEHTEDYHDRKQNDKIFLFKKEEKTFIYVGENLVGFERKDKVLKYHSKLGLNDFKYPYAHCEQNTYFMLHQNSIPIPDYETSTEKNEYHYLHKKR